MFWRTNIRPVKNGLKLHQLQRWPKRGLQWCPEMLVHARAHVLRSGNYISFSVALQRARVELLGGPFSPEPTGQRNSKPEPDRCWAVDRAALTS